MEFKFAKIQNSHVQGGWGGGVGRNQFPTFDAEFKFAKIQNPHVQGGWEGGWEVGGTNFQLLMLSSNLLKSIIPMFRVGGGGVGGNQFPTFDAEFKFAKIHNSHVQGWWGEGGVGGNQFPTFDAEFKFAKIHNSHVQGWWGEGGVGGNQFPTFDAEFKFANIQNPHVQGG